MYKYKIGDTVKVTAGKDLGQTGKILEVLPRSHRIVVEGLNQYKRHLKARNNQPGKMIEKSRPIPVANIALVCPGCHKPTRVGFDATQEPKVRICKKCGHVIKNQESKK